MSSMKSKSALDAYTFDLPEPTPEEVAALERAERRVQLSPEEYLRFLELVTKDLPPSREPDGPWPEPFEL